MTRTSTKLLLSLSLSLLAPLAGCDDRCEHPDAESCTTDADTDTGLHATSIMLSAGMETGEPGTTGMTDTTGATDIDATDGVSDTDATETGETDGCPELCGCVPALPRPEPPSIVLVLDKSGSMFVKTWDHDHDDLDGDGISDLVPGQPATPEVTRWNSLHRVVETIANDFDDRVSLGAQLFPALDASSASPELACVVDSPPEVAVAPGNAATLLASIPSADELALAGGTPAERGIASAADHLVALDDVEFAGSKHMLLITDGGANCSVDAEPSFAGVSLADPKLVATVEEALAGWGGDAPIETLVVGIDIEDAYDDTLQANPLELLNEVADAGGRALEGEERFYNATDEDQLLAAIEGLIGEISCTIPLGEDGQPGFTTLELEVDGEPLAELDASACDDGAAGWSYADDLEPHMSVRL
ncbi:MAG: VWA domain-containing protein, partial [Myxococcales bacterium]|nr:VWA domain-containing protein [Myxococcales bacterium]